MGRVESRSWAFSGDSMLNLPSLEQAKVYDKPFPFVVVPNFISEQHLEEIERDYPAITKPGSFPLETLRSGPRFSNFMHELRQPAFREIMEASSASISKSVLLQSLCAGRREEPTDEFISIAKASL